MPELLTRRRITSSLLFMTIVLQGVNFGCGTAKPDPYARQPVSGQVTFDGQLLAAGAITFFPKDKGPIASGAPIVDGKYFISKKDGLPAGSYKVTISSHAIKGGSSRDPNAFPEYEERIPSQYNSKTTLECELAPEQHDKISFNLVSKAK